MPHPNAMAITSPAAEMIRPVLCSLQNPGGVSATLSKTVAPPGLERGVFDARVVPAQREWGRAARQRTHHLRVLAAHPIAIAESSSKPRWRYSMMRETRKMS